MTYPSWPAELPKPERNTWQKTNQDPRLKRRSDAGPASYRRRFSSVAKTVALSVLLTRNEKAIFDKFYEEETGFGARLFFMPDPTTDGWALKTADGQQLLTSDGVPILLGATWLVTLGDQVPAEAVVGTSFRISFNVQVMP